MINVDAPAAHFSDGQRNNKNNDDNDSGDNNNDYVNVQWARLSRTHLRRYVRSAGPRARDAIRLDCGVPSPDEIRAYFS